MKLVDFTVDSISKHLDRFEKEGREVYVSSSFQTQSIPLLHLVSKNFKQLEIIFIDTGYLFSETYGFMEKIKNDFELNVVTLSSKMGYNQQKASDGLMLYSEAVDKCCFINKVDPVQHYIDPGDVWISGVRMDQSAIRGRKEELEMDSRGVVRYHPMLEWTSRDVYQYIKEHNLPKHPLEEAGYTSIGCVPCTNKWKDISSRDGRWVGSRKTECGLHITVNKGM